MSQTTGLREIEAESTTVELTALGVTVNLSIAGPERHGVVASLRGAWARCAEGPSAPERSAGWIRIRTDTDPVAIRSAAESGDVSGAALLELMDKTSEAITRRAVAAQIGCLWIVRGAAVADRETGAAVLLVGEPGVGTTTLCRRLAVEFGYVADDAVGIADDGSLAPYPRPLGVAAQIVPWKHQIGPDAIGLAWAPDTPRLALVLLLRRVDGAHTSLRYLAPEVAEGMLLRESYGVAPGKVRRPVIRPHLDRIGGAVEVVYSNGADLLPVVRNLLV